VIKRNYNIVSVSGGKDSAALLLLAIECDTKNLRPVFADTGHEHPVVYEYLDYLERRLGVTIERLVPDFSAQIARKREVVQTKWRAEGISEQRIERALSVLHPTGIPFLDLCLWKGRFPSTKARFCTEFLKRNPIERYIQPMLDNPDTGDVYSWQGVRAQESQQRAKLCELEESEKHAGLWHYRPILKWTAAEVFDFHRKHGVKWNPLYEQGMGRVGCMPCVNCRKGELQEIARRFPEQISRVREWEQLVSNASKRGSATLFPAVIDPMASADDDISPETHGIDRAVEWSKTARGGRQFDLIASTAPSVGCASAYGLCDTGVV
jgi:3'-phosphoadenosine 5'-phosphosulfate sulfotransferase (PAPS reductase)/FAD synthetase